jgi:RHS repeat-associated protein
MVEWVKYSSYGVPFALPAGDTDSDGDWDATDSAAITGAYEVRKDANLDGVINASDVTHANSITGGYQTLGRGRLSSSGVDNRKGYAGYEYDPTLEGAGKWLYHVRHRVYDADIGRWTRRDPLGYVDGMSLYEYVQSQPVTATDPLGLAAATCRYCSSAALPSSCDEPVSAMAGQDCPGGVIVWDPRMRGGRCRCVSTGRLIKCPPGIGPPKKKPPGRRPRIPVIGVGECAIAYSHCLDQAQKDYESYLRACRSLPPRDIPQCHRDADHSYDIDVAICVAEYLKCSLRELLPW